MPEYGCVYIYSPRPPMKDVRTLAGPGHVMPCVDAAERGVKMADGQEELRRPGDRGSGAGLLELTARLARLEAPLGPRDSPLEESIEYCQAFCTVRAADPGRGVSTAANGCKHGHRLGHNTTQTRLQTNI